MKHTACRWRQNVQSSFSWQWNSHSSLRGKQLARRLFSDQNLSRRFFLSACVTSTTKLGLFDNITRCQTIAFYLVIFTSTVLFGLVWVCFIGNSAIWVRSSCCSNSFSMFKNKESCSTHTQKTLNLFQAVYEETKSFTNTTTFRL